LCIIGKVDLPPESGEEKAMPRSKIPNVSLDEAKARFEAWRQNRKGKAWFGGMAGSNSLRLDLEQVNTA
jgi:hypothetical protein